MKAEPVDLDTEAASEKRGGLFMNMCFRAGEAIALFKRKIDKSGLL